MHRPVVLVDAEEREVEIVARVAEVVGIAAVERGLLLGRHDQAHVGVALVAIERVLAAAVELDHLRLEPGLLRGLLLDLGDRRAPLGALGLARRLGVDRPGHSRCDVLGRGQHLELEVRALHLLARAARVEAVLHVIMLRGRDLGELAERDVVVGEHQAVGRDERAGAAAEVHAALADLRDPPRRRDEPVALAELLGREVVERPHALVGARRRGAEDDRGEQRDERRETRDGMGTHVRPLEGQGETPIGPRRKDYARGPGPTRGRGRASSGRANPRRPAGGGGS